MKLHGTTTVGPKGQVVIPKEVRDLLNINPGDSITIVTKDNKAVAMIKNEDLKELFEYIKSEGIELE
ncbi:MAG: AbrB/MazE/SpoVT family DNA-binding domain-containing protein [Candidatus Gracilibacteria bacterium]|nr:AbrB/MazE/SpoVT family DNA-binding domain-containing protein [Candidatus Gracilibacteria bacterium]